MKKFLSNINKEDFVRYFLFSVLIIVFMVIIGKLEITKARYQTVTDVNFSPNLAFFLVDVTETSGQIRLENILPSQTPYEYTFNVSNFNSSQMANVDLTYSIEIITTTNMPLTFTIHKGNDNNTNQIDADSFTTDVNGVYYRHLVINDVSSFSHSVQSTDSYKLIVEFPYSYRSNPGSYAGIIDLIDIKINAEQVVL